MKLLKSLIIITLFFLLFGNFASAHTLKTDKAFSMILHVEPNDEPIAKQKSDIRLLFTQTPPNFDPAQASCIVEIYKGDKLLYRQDVLRETQTIDDIHFNFVFPEIGIYEIKVSGKSDKPNSFQPFNLSYDLRIEKSAINNFFSKHSQSYILIFFFLIVFFASVIIIYYHVKKTSN